VERPIEISVVVPAYQEADDIEEVLDRLCHTLKQRFENFEIIVVADGCTDGTEIRAASHADPRVKVLSYQQNRGKGYALREGTKEATGKYVAFCDGDLDIHPESILVLYDLLLLGDAEVVVGSKMHPNSIVDYPRFRRVQSLIFRKIVQLLFRLKVTDTQTGLKVFLREALNHEIQKVDTEGFAFDLELLIRMSKKNKIIEGPVWLTYQFSSSVTILMPIKMLYDCIEIRSRRHREHW
jgi:glycosyltransferase involved in cell wall biosynthesis